MIDLPQHQVHVGDVANQVEAAVAPGKRSKAGPLAIAAISLSGLSLALLLRIGPLSIFIAPIGALLGLIALVRRKPAAKAGLSIAAIVVGTVVSALSLVMIVGSQPA